MSLMSAGAGAAAGLETLLTRMRVEEQQKALQQNMLHQQKHEDAQLDLANRAENSRELDAQGARELQKIRLDSLKSFLNPEQSAAPAQQDHSVVPGSPEDVQRGGMTQVGSVQPIGAGAAPASSGNAPGSIGPDRFNAKRRTQAMIAGLNPNEIFGSVPTPPQPKGPEDLSAEEAFYSGQAAKDGYQSYKAWGKDRPEKLAAARRDWAQESHFVNPSQASEMLVQVDDPAHPGQSIWTPRSQAGGMRSSLPVGQKDRLMAYDNSIALAHQILQTGDKLNWTGLGPIKGRIGRIGMEYLGVGNPEEEHLRNMIDQLKASASFQEGGKQFTGTEKELLDNFLIGVNQNPIAAKQRLRTFIESAQRSRSSLNGQGAGSDSAPAPKGGGKVTITSVEEVK